jgi:hypothetical protein
MYKELLEYLNKADAEDLARCLVENFSNENQERHYKMLSEIYWNDKSHFNALSDGCKAAALIYIFLGGHMTWAETHLK